MLLVILASGASVVAAWAGPEIDSASATRAKPGAIVQLRAGAGLRLWEVLPLYLVRASSAPAPTPCRLRNGHAALCSPTAPSPPTGGTYHRIATIDTRHSNMITVRFRVPTLSPGSYVYVFYCGGCTKGPRGSLVVWAQRPRLTILR